MDNVLNLSAFGEIIENPSKDKDSAKGTDFDLKLTRSADVGKDKAPEKPVKENKYQNVVKCSLEFSAQIKLLHWQTHSYSEHKTLNKFFDNYIDLTDELVETIMGKYGRQRLDEESCNLKIGNYHDPQMDGLVDFTRKMCDCYINDCRPTFDKEQDQEILNIIDEIIALVQKTKYLLSLK